MNKGPLALRTISETADQVGVPQHVLRFWETKFPFIRPTKRAGGRRFYRPQDIDLLLAVKALLYDRGYTIRGVQKLFKDEGQKAILAPDVRLPADAHGGMAGPSDDVAQGDDQPIGDDETGGDEIAPARSLSQETRQRFLDIARALEDAQEALGRQIGRPGGRGNGRGKMS